MRHTHKNSMQYWLYILRKRRKTNGKIISGKVRKLYVTNTSSDSVTLKENAEKAKVFADELEAETLANILGAQLITFVLEG